MAANSFLNSLIPASTPRPQTLDGNTTGVSSNRTSTDSGLSYPDSLKQQQIASNLVNQQGGAPGQGFLLQNQSYLEFQNYLNNRLRQDLQRYQGNQAAGANTNNQVNQYGVYREPWIFTVFEDLTNANALSNTDSGVLGVQAAAQAITSSNSNKSIVWVANPKSVSWQINQRGVETKNKSGTVLHVWRDKTRGSDYDDPKITMQFQSGNLYPTANSNTGGADPNSPLTQIPGGLNNFYQFLALVDRSKIAANGQANLVNILYRSRIFPSLILTGFFDPQLVVQFTDDSQNPLQVSSWQATFTVYSTSPKLNDAATLAGIFQTDGALATTETGSVAGGGQNFGSIA